MRWSMTVRDGGLVEKLKLLAREEVALKREEFVRSAGLIAMRGTIERTPVDRGEARASWTEVLKLLGEETMVGPEWGVRVEESREWGESSGNVEWNRSPELSEVRCRSDVEHVVYLEYGTRRMPPGAMVQKSLADAAASLAFKEFLTLSMLRGGQGG